jgi:hypothetical protein
VGPSLDEKIPPPRKIDPDLQPIHGSIHAGFESKKGEWSRNDVLWCLALRCRVLFARHSTVVVNVVRLLDTSTFSKDGSFDAVTAKSLFLIIAWGMFIHFLFLLINYLITVVMRFDLDISKSIVIQCSQKVKCRRGF